MDNTYKAGLLKAGFSFAKNVINSLCENSRLHLLNIARPCEERRKLIKRQLPDIVRQKSGRDEPVNFKRRRLNKVRPQPSEQLLYALVKFAVLDIPSMDISLSAAPMGSAGYSSMSAVSLSLHSGRTLSSRNAFDALTMHKRFLQEQRPILYNTLLLSEKLYPLLREVDETANERRSRGVSEEVIFSELAYDGF